MGASGGCAVCLGGGRCAVAPWPECACMKVGTRQRGPPGCRGLALGSGGARESGKAQVGRVIAARAAGGGAAGWSRGARGFVQRLCVGALSPLSPGLTAAPGDAALVRCVAPAPLLPGIRHSPSPTPVPPCLASAQGPDPSVGSSKAQRGSGGPLRLPARPIAASSVAWRGRRRGRNQEDAAAAAADEPGQPSPSPPCASGLQSRCSFQHLLIPSASSWEAGFPRPRRLAGVSSSLCLSVSRLSLSLFHSPSFPFPVPSSLLTPWSPPDRG